MLWKRIRYYTYVAVILILSGIYLFNLRNLNSQYIAGTGNIKIYFARYSPYLIIIIVSLRYAKDIVTGTGNTIIGAYGKLTEEEKELYDISKVKKVKMSEILCVLSLVIVTVLAFVFLELFPNAITPQIFLACYLVEIVMLLILSRTKWLLNWFCKKK